jgi:hypothetical protein
MKRYSPLLLLLLLGSLAVSQAVAAAATRSGATPLLSRAVVDLEESGVEFGEEGEDFETEECEAFLGDEAFFEEFGAEEEEEEEEGFEFGEEECEGDAKKAANGTVGAPSACLVRQAESKITTLPGSDRVELTVHYEAWTPAAVSVGLALKDGKGTLDIEHATKHLGLGGTLHLSTRLGDAVMERAAKAKEFDISLRAAKTPSFCGDLLEQHLRTSRPVGRARIYSDPRGD